MNIITCLIKGAKGVGHAATRQRKDTTEFYGKKDY